LAITSPTSGGISVGIVRSRTQTIEFSFFYLVHKQQLFEKTADFAQDIGMYH
jgi:hypothetical protein